MRRIPPRRNQRLQEIAAEALKEVYFQDGGRRAGNLLALPALPAQRQNPQGNCRAASGRHHIRDPGIRAELVAVVPAFTPKRDDLAHRALDTPLAVIVGSQDAGPSLHLNRTLHARARKAIDCGASRAARTSFLRRELPQFRQLCQGGADVPGPDVRERFGDVADDLGRQPESKPGVPEGCLAR